MKKLICILMITVLLAGCSAVETLETLGNISHLSPTAPQMRQVMLTLPEDASLETAQTDMGIQAYSCENYTAVLQTFRSGDLMATIRSLTGFSFEDLTVMESQCGDHKRYDWVWTAMGEEGEVVCRGSVLDDGEHHYTLCVMADAEAAGQVKEQWNTLFGSFCLES